MKILAALLLMIAPLSAASEFDKFEDFFNKHRKPVSAEEQHQFFLDDVFTHAYYITQYNNPSEMSLSEETVQTIGGLEAVKSLFEKEEYDIELMGSQNDQHLFKIKNHKFSERVNKFIAAE